MSEFWLPFTRETKKIYLDLSTTAIFVLDYLLDETVFNHKKSTTLSYSQISKAINKHRPNVINAVHELEKKKRIYVRRDGLKRVRISVSIVLGLTKSDSSESATINGSESATIRGSENTTINGSESATNTLLEIKDIEDSNNRQPILQNQVAKKTERQLKLERFEKQNFHHVKKDSDNYPLPEWMDTETWEEFLAMRIRIKKPPTPAAKKKLINKMERICNEFFDGNMKMHLEILNESIMNSWSGVFEPKVKKSYTDYEKEKRNNAIRDFHTRMSKANGVVQ